MQLAAPVCVCSFSSNTFLLLSVYIEGLLIDFYASFHDWEEHLKQMCPKEEVILTKCLQGVQDNFNCFIIKVIHCFPL